MDRNSLAGFILIGAILAGFWFLNKPTADQIAAEQRMKDSIANVQKLAAEQQALNAVNNPESYNTEQGNGQDSSSIANYNQQRYGVLAPFAMGAEKSYVLENDKVKLTISNKGARITSVNLKEYEDKNYEPLYLFQGEESSFNISFFSYEKREVATESLFFNSDAQLVTDATSGAKSVVFSVTPGESQAIEISYTLEPGSYMPKLSINGDKLLNLMARADNSILLNWQLHMPQVEKGLDFEKRYSGLYYKHYEDDVEFIKGGKEDVKEFPTRVKWVGFKDQFFSSVLIANEYFTSADVAQTNTTELGYIAKMKADLDIPVSNGPIDMQFYFGPNHYKTLNQTGYDLKKMINLGIPPMKYINQLLVIPLFNGLSRVIGNFGIIILILTIIIKLIIFPFTFKSYISTAKMRVLKPQIDEATAKFGPDKQMEKQQATMAIYNKAGVNPMGGCLPMLFQMPVLFAMFYFFPSSIELRHESFLWAKDLASYDAILTWEGNLPLIGNLLGNHLSLFTILMSITNLLYTMVNQEMTATTQQMKGMKTMMYLMPIMFFFMFNKYAAGLSYYYFISTLITIGQTFAMRRFVNEDKLLKQLEQNKKKPKKKSGFAARLEEMQKQQQAAMKDQQKRKK